MMVIWRRRSGPTSLSAFRMSCSSSMKSSGHGGTPNAPWLRKTSFSLQRMPASRSFFFTCLTSVVSEGGNNIFISGGMSFLYLPSEFVFVQYGQLLKDFPGNFRDGRLLEKQPVE